MQLDAVMGCNWLLTATLMHVTGHHCRRCSQEAIITAGAGMDQ